MQRSTQAEPRRTCEKTAEFPRNNRNTKNPEPRTSMRASFEPIHHRARGINALLQCV
jgi:hypothetical protein